MSTENSGGTSPGGHIRIFADCVSGPPQSEHEPVTLDNAGSQREAGRQGTWHPTTGQGQSGVTSTGLERLADHFLRPVNELA